MPARLWDWPALARICIRVSWNPATVNESHHISFYQQLQHTSEDIPLGLQKKGQCWACLSTPVDYQTSPKKARETGKLSVMWSNLGKMEATERGTRKPGGEGQPVPAIAREMVLSAQRTQSSSAG